MLKVLVKNYDVYIQMYHKNTLRELLCKPKDRVAIEDKSNTVYKIDCSNCEAVYFGKSKQSLKSHSDEHKISARNCNCD